MLARAVIFQNALAGPAEEESYRFLPRSITCFFESAFQYIFDSVFLVLIPGL